ncbi:MAG TPA: hypothetical protein VHY37_09880 [Tepidisphaeraceae bacterium]|jgi:mRNA-degrading endonuclease RelE of RelBE toxin-antitoxin system|nr:hypothetical protein [Tepidisphaeraceae bacterium]
MIVELHFAIAWAETMTTTLSPDAEFAVRSIPDPERGPVARAIEALPQSVEKWRRAPKPSKIRRLRGRVGGREAFALRAGDFRIIFSLNPGTNGLFVVNVLHKARLEQFANGSEPTTNAG